MCPPRRRRRWPLPPRPKRLLPVPGPMRSGCQQAKAEQTSQARQRRPRPRPRCRGSTATEDAAVEDVAYRSRRGHRRCRGRGDLDGGDDAAGAAAGRVATIAKCAAAILAVIGIAALASTSAWICVKHRRRAAARLSAEFSAAARQGVVTLMSLDFNRAEEDVQRIVDNSTGEFREDFPARPRSSPRWREVEGRHRGERQRDRGADDDRGHRRRAGRGDLDASPTPQGAKQEPRSWRLSVSVAATATRSRWRKWSSCRDREERRRRRRAEPDASRGRMTTSPTRADSADEPRTVRRRDGSPDRAGRRRWRGRAAALTLDGDHAARRPAARVGRASPRGCTSASTEPDQADRGRRGRARSTRPKTAPSRCCRTRRRRSTRTSPTPSPISPATS